MGFVEQIFLSNTGGTIANVTAQNALKVDGSAVTQPVSKSGSWNNLGISGGTIAASQNGTWNVATLSSITNPVAVTKSGSWINLGISGGTVSVNKSGAWTNIGISGGTIAASQSGTWNIGTLSSITNPVAVTKSGGWVNLGISGGTISVNKSGNWNNLGISGGTIAASQSGTWNIGTVTTLSSITNPVAVSKSGAWTNLGVSGGTIAASQSGTWNIGTVSTLTTITNPVAVTKSGGWVNLGISGGTVSVNKSGAWTNLGVSGGTITARIVGNAGASIDAATAASVPANAIYKGGRGTTALPTAVSDGQLVGAMTDKFGRQIVVNGTVRDLIGTAILSNNSSSSAVSFIAAGAAGVFNDIITLVITNRSSTATVVSLSDNGAAGNIYTFAISANGGIVINFPTPIPQGTAAAAWNVLNSAAVALDYITTYAKNK